MHLAAPMACLLSRLLPQSLPSAPEEAVLAALCIATIPVQLRMPTTGSAAYANHTWSQVAVRVLTSCTGRGTYRATPSC